MQNLRIILLPFSWIYGFIVFLRNRFYDWRLFSSSSSPLFTVVIGNLNTGGTGKTPHTLLLSRWFSEPIAILSRGYGRSSKGYRNVLPMSDATEVGDEPLIYANNSNQKVVVCEDRLEGIHQLYDEGHRGVVLLDDAFQHRKLRADFNILLIAKAKPIFNDFYLPSGDLRDSKREVRRADAIIITGCDGSESPEYWRQKLRLSQKQTLFFSRTVQKELRSFSGESDLPKKRIGLITAIAKAHRIKSYLEKEYDVIKHWDYRDHHSFKEQEIQTWMEFASKENVDLVTTEKDAMRMRAFQNSFKGTSIWIAPIEVEIDGAELLKKQMLQCYDDAKKSKV